MNDIQYRQATIQDIPTLIDCRIAFLTELMGPQTDEDTETLNASLINYYSEAIDNNRCIAIIAMDSDILAAAGVMTIRRQLGSFKNPSGLVGYIQNMYTAPAYRRQGIGTTILHMLQDGGKAIGITAYELHATKDGEPVYIKDGFRIHPEPTYRKYS